jgi:hypothetical protein
MANSPPSIFQHSISPIPSSATPTVQQVYAMAAAAKVWKKAMHSATAPVPSPESPVADWLDLGLDRTGADWSGLEITSAHQLSTGAPVLPLSRHPVSEPKLGDDGVHTEAQQVSQVTFVFAAMQPILAGTQEERTSRTRSDEVAQLRLQVAATSPAHGMDDATKSGQQTNQVQPDYQAINALMHVHEAVAKALLDVQAISAAFAAHKRKMENSIATKSAPTTQCDLPREAQMWRGVWSWLRLWRASLQALGAKCQPFLLLIINYLYHALELSRTGWLALSVFARRTILSS